jgi:ankyrin repeat protein
MAKTLLCTLLPAQLGRRLFWNNVKESPLKLAAQKGNDVAIKTLLAHGANVNLQSTHWEVTPLMMALQNEHQGSAMILWKEGGASTEIKDKDGRTCAYYAAFGGVLSFLKEVLSSLLEKGLENLDAMLVAACQENRLDVATYLVSLGANVNGGTAIVAPSSETPLVLSCRLKSPEKDALVRFLLSKGADVNGIAPYGTALWWACGSKSSKEIVTALLEAGASVTAQYSDDSVWHTAVSSTNLDAIEALAASTEAIENHRCTVVRTQRGQLYSAGGGSILEEARVFFSYDSRWSSA